MRVCCGLTGHLELARRPDLYGKPVIVGRWDEHVVAASEETLPFGVTPGMAMRQAEHLCPQATFVLPDEEATDRIRELISAALYDLAPVVEVRGEGIAWLDTSGVAAPGASIRDARHRLLKAIGREPRLGLSPGPSSARLAAARARPGHLLRVADAREFLAPLPSRELPLDAEQLELESAALETRESVVRHPLSSTVELFGLIGGWIKEWQPSAPITELWIELPVLEGAGRRQLRLWAGGDGTSQEVEAAMERLQERFGDGVIARVSFA